MSKFQSCGEVVECRDKMKDVLFVLLAVFVLRGANGTEIRGLRPGRAKYYNPNEEFSCFDGSDTVPFSYVNDDYCDCRCENKSCACSLVVDEKHSKVV